MTRRCSIDGCTGAHEARGWCAKHYQAWRDHGSPTATKPRRPKGAGGITKDGYFERTHDGVTVLDHVAVAQHALGKPLPVGAVVHHVDENKSNNTPANLVICPSQAYHLLLHQRMRAFAASGHYDWRKCNVCKQYDSPDRLRFYQGNAPVHLECRRVKKPLQPKQPA